MNGKQKRSGSILLPVILLVLDLALFGWIGYSWYSEKNAEKDVTIAKEDDADDEGGHAARKDETGRDDLSRCGGKGQT